MKRYQRTRRALAIGVYVIIACLGLVSSPRAQVSGQGAPGIEPPPVNSGRPDEFARPGRGEEGLPVGTWLLYPSAFAGVDFDTNVNQAAVNPHSAVGLRLAPDLRLENDTGIRKTTIYAAVDGRVYPGQNVGNANSVSARAGVTEAYVPLPDVILNGQLDYTRQLNMFGTLGYDSSASTLNTTGVGIAPTSNAPAYNQYTGVASVQKNFDRAFAIVSGSIVDVSYDSSPAGTTPAPDGVVYTGTGRGGFWIVPVLYGYVEGSLDKRDYTTGGLSSSGYRTVAGIGSDQIGLLRGETYAGYESESGSSSGTVGSYVLGARGYYYPLPELTLSASADESIGVSLLATTATSPTGTSTRVTTFLGTGTYSLDPEWTTSGRAGYAHTSYVGSTRRDGAWTVGGTLTYSVWRNFGLTLDYQHVDSSSNVPLQSYTEDIVTTGVSYKY